MMRMVTMHTLVGMACLLSVTVYGDEPNTPAVIPATVRAEVERGRKAVIHVANTVKEPVKFEDAVDLVEYQNHQKHTDTDGFELGLEFAAWQADWKRLSRGDTFGTLTGENKDYAKLMALHAQEHFRNYRKFCGKLNISGEQRTEIFKAYGYDSLRDDAAWEDAVHANSYKDTMPGK